MYPVCNLGDKVHEYCRGCNIEITRSDGVYDRGVSKKKRKGHGRFVVRSFCGDGFPSEVDLAELLTWVKNNMPDLWAEIK